MGACKLPRTVEAEETGVTATIKPVLARQDGGNAGVDGVHAFPILPAEGLGVDQNPGNIRDRVQGASGVAANPEFREDFPDTQSLFRGADASIGG